VSRFPTAFARKLVVVCGPDGGMILLGLAMARKVRLTQNVNPMRLKREGPRTHRRVALPTALRDLDICDLTGT